MDNNNNNVNNNNNNNVNNNNNNNVNNNNNNNVNNNNVNNNNVNNNRNNDDNDNEVNEVVRNFLASLINRLNVASGSTMRVPNAPVKASNPCPRPRRVGLPRPFEPRPAAKRILFMEPQPPIPAMPQCPPRRRFRRTESRINKKLDGVVKRKLDFNRNGGCDDQDQGTYPSPSGASNVETPNYSLLNAPKKRRLVIESDEEVEMEEEVVDECPAAPTNTPATPADNDIDLDDAIRWNRISTPASAPLPSTFDSPLVPRTRRRRSDGPVCFTRKRLSF